MKVLIVGCGKMGSAIAYDLIGNQNLETIILADSNKDAIHNVTNLINKRLWQTTYKDKIPIICGKHLSRGFKNEFRNILSNQHIDIIISAADYSINKNLTKLAIEFGCNMCDLGGNNDVVEQQFKLDSKAKTKGVTIIPSCGLAPGLGDWIAGYGIKKFQDKFKTNPDTVKIYVGGLPQNPTPPLNYKLVFSARGLINEYIESCTILRNNEIVSVEPLTEIEDFDMMWKLEAFHTSGGSSNLPLLYKNQVKNLEYKTIRYPGHCNIFAGMKQLGLFEEDNRSNIENIITKKLTNDDKDLVLMRVVVKNDKNNIVYELADHHDPLTGFSAMARCTAFPTAIVANWLGNKTINVPGVVSGCEVINVFDLITELQKRNINISEEYF